MKGVKKLYYWCVFFTILLFSLMQLYFYLNPTTIEEDNSKVYNKIKSRDIKSTFKRIGIDYSNRRATYIVYGSDSIPFILDWEERIVIGDSIIKPIGSLKLIIKDSIGIKDTLDYKENERIILTDDF